jgi:RNA polymerase sigma-70 factor (ECF subfamily)
MLREVDGLNTAETAESLGVSEDVVKTRLSRGRAALRNQLAERARILAPDAFRFPQPRCDRSVGAVFARIL